HGVLSAVGRLMREYCQSITRVPDNKYYQGVASAVVGTQAAQGSQRHLLLLQTT
ncbi:hypothetical protein AX16_001161, partial [Volvariella volvacea WC 439]